MKFASIVFLAFALGGAASAEPLTVDQLMRSPDRYAGQAVRVVGQIDNCVAFSCNLCPQDMTHGDFDREDCLGLEFDSFAGTDDPRVSALLEDAFRFSTVVLDARFDPKCLTDRGTCSERETTLFDARVLHVIARKDASEGLVSWYREGRLVAPERDDARAMRAEWDLLGRFPNATAQFFLIQRYSLQPERASATGLGCVCFAGSCDGHWPTHYFGGFNAPANPFRCYEMEKFAEGWRLLPD